MGSSSTARQRARGLRARSLFLAIAASASALGLFGIGSVSTDPSVQAQAVDCSSFRADVWIANDESNSVDAAGFDQARDFIFELTDTLPFDAVDGVQAYAAGWARDYADITPGLSADFADPGDTGLFRDSNLSLDGDAEGIREIYDMRFATVLFSTRINRPAQELLNRFVRTDLGRRDGVPQIPVIITDAARNDIVFFGDLWIELMNQLRASVPDVHPVVILVDDATTAYRTDINAKATVDAATGGGTLFLVDDYPQFADVSSDWVNRVAEAICVGADDPVGGALNVDRGDAPASYGEARNFVPSGPADFYFGATPPDVDGAPLGGSAATDDDEDGVDDEDALDRVRPIGTDFTSYTIPADDLTVTGDGLVYAWVDFDMDGTFTTSEVASTTVAGGVMGGDLTWPTLPALVPGDTYLRLRVVPDDLLFDRGGSPEDDRATFPVALGETEDHLVKVQPPGADLEIVQAGPATAVAGTDVTLTLTATNLGTDPASAAEVVTTLPPGLALSSPPADCTLLGQVLTCDAGDLAVGATWTTDLVVAVAPDASGPLTNPADVSSVTVDPDPSNNTDPLVIDVTGVADLTIIKAVDAPVLDPGGRAIWTIEVTNNGPSTATSVEITDEIPTGLVPSATGTSTSCTVSGQSVACAIGSLDVGASISVDVATDVSADASGELTNTATATATEDADASTATAAASITEPTPTTAPPTTASTPTTLPPELPETGSPTTGTTTWAALLLLLTGLGFTGLARHRR